MKHHSPAAYAQAFIRSQKSKLDREKETLYSRLIAMMRANDDEKKIPATLRAILRLLAEEKANQRVRVVTSIESSAQEKLALQKQFLSLRDISRRETDFTFKWEVRPEILGGLVVEQGTRLYQMSLRHLLKGFER